MHGMKSSKKEKLRESKLIGDASSQFKTRNLDDPWSRKIVSSQTTHCQNKKTLEKTKVKMTRLNAQVDLFEEEDSNLPIGKQDLNDSKGSHELKAKKAQNIESPWSRPTSHSSNRPQKNHNLSINSNHSESSHPRQCNQHSFETNIKKESLDDPWCAKGSYKSTLKAVDQPLDIEDDEYNPSLDHCLICLVSLNAHDAFWQCEQCTCHEFHYTCILTWIDQYKKNKESKSLNVAEARLISPSTQEINQWFCPKCRLGHRLDYTPSPRYCYCGSSEEALEYQVWRGPRCCDQLCSKKLKPECGHRCVDPCHPSKCPPCPKMVDSACYCGKRKTMRRCHDKIWSCREPCDRILSCRKHKCANICHEGPCPPCPREHTISCHCGRQHAQRKCEETSYSCPMICNKPYGCEGDHRCQKTCHPAGECGVCPGTLPRTCPCGKETFTLPCSQDLPTCKNICGKSLNCGIHKCKNLCHTNECAPCMTQVSLKSCLCGKHKKEIPCSQTFTCHVKCQKLRDCQRHRCNRLCCDGHCPPCKKVCQKKLQCGQHTCESICHQGPCYPCEDLMSLSCACGEMKEVKPCGPRKKLYHPVERTCLGQHQVVSLSCKSPQFIACEEPCGQYLNCGIHKCDKKCHLKSYHRTIETTDEGIAILKEEAIKYDPNVIKREKPEPCEPCARACLRTNPNCGHPCLEKCHPGECPWCSAKNKTDCHCGDMEVTYYCFEKLDKKAFNEKLMCGGPCRKSLPCGHPCNETCHPNTCKGACPIQMKVKCQCKRSFKLISCDEAQQLIKRQKKLFIECEDTCQVKRQQSEVKQKVFKVEAPEIKLKKSSEVKKGTETKVKKKRRIGEEFFKEHPPLVNKKKGFSIRTQYIILVTAIICLMISMVIMYRFVK